MKPNLNEIMKQAQEMQTKMQQAQKELSQAEVIGKAGADPDIVKAYKRGLHFYRIEIASMLHQMAPNLKNEDIEVLEDLIVAAVNDAINKFEGVSKDKMTKLTSSMGLPADLNLDNQDKGDA